MFFTGLFPAGNWVAWFIAHLLGLGVTAQRSSTLPLSRLLRNLPGNAATNDTPIARGPGVIIHGPAALHGHCISTVQYQGVYVKAARDALHGTYCASYLWEPVTVFPKIASTSNSYATATASAGLLAINLPTRSDNCAPLPVQ
jgi:hypothetical protein